jgi:hypothetical protein
MCPSADEKKAQDKQRLDELALMERNQKEEEEYIKLKIAQPVK